MFNMFYDYKYEPTYIVRYIQVQIYDKMLYITHMNLSRLFAIKDSQPIIRKCTITETLLFYSNIDKSK